MSYMFKGAKFNGDISHWLPYDLSDTIQMFNNSLTPIPYWFHYDNRVDRKKAIEKYQLSQALSDELSQNNNLSRKIKI
jgi:hypothetical protein